MNLWSRLLLSFLFCCLFPPWSFARDNVSYKTCNALQKSFRYPQAIGCFCALHQKKKRLHQLWNLARVHTDLRKRLRTVAPTQSAVHLEQAIQLYKRWLTKMRQLHPKAGAYEQSAMTVGQRELQALQQAKKPSWLLLDNGSQAFKPGLRLVVSSSSLRCVWSRKKGSLQCRYHWGKAASHCHYRAHERLLDARRRWQLPPGRYRLQLWSRRLLKRQFGLQLKAGETSRVLLALDVQPSPITLQPNPGFSGFLVGGVVGGAVSVASLTIALTMELLALQLYQTAYTQGYVQTGWRQFYEQAQLLRTLSQAFLAVGLVSGLASGASLTVWGLREKARKKRLKSNLSLTGGGPSSRLLSEVQFP